MESMDVAHSDQVRQLIELARREDFGDGDLSAGLLPDGQRIASFHLVAEQAGVFAGREVAPLVLQAYHPAIAIDWSAKGVDGARIDQAPCPLATISGPLAVVLSAERVLLNFLQRLSGVASLTRRFVDAVAGTNARIYDTRKTTPGWRTLEKYAVQCGGGCNHRMGLHDAVMLKDNHLVAVETPRLAGTVFEMLNQLAASGARPAFVCVEADTIGQVEQFLKVVGVDIILLDNFTIGGLQQAVRLRRDSGAEGKVAFEASGGVSLETVRAIAETGVERISVGAITHSATALSMKLERVE